MSEDQKLHERVSLKVIDAPRIGSVLNAPPALIFSNHTVDYACGYCAAVLMHAEPGQINNLYIQCTKCGCYNSTDV
jgi:hypothetical protein